MSKWIIDSVYEYLTWDKLCHMWKVQKKMYQIIEGI